MSQEQAVIIAILAATVAMFLWGRWRHDVVAVMALLACVLTGLVPDDTAFTGFGHPAVITVACVLILSRGLQASGVVDAVAKAVLPESAGAVSTIAATTALAALLSAFMNNVGALALLMPVAIQIAVRQNLPPGKVLMPVAFGSILGGMTTLIGTPPNLIVSGFRLEAGPSSFAMFDFAPVGLTVAIVGIVFVTLIGWRLVPARKTGQEGFETSAYLTETRIPDGSKAAGMRLREIRKVLEAAEADIVGLVRDEVRVPAPSPAWKVRAGDILLLEAEPDALASALSGLDLKLEEEEDVKAGPAAKADDEGVPNEDASKREKNGKEEKVRSSPAGSDEIVPMELVVLPTSSLIGRSATGIRLRTRYGINLLAISRQGRRSMARLKTTPIRAGDVLLMQGEIETLNDFAVHAGCAPLAERPLHLPDRRKALLSAGIMAAAVGVAAAGLVPAAIAFAAGALFSMLLQVISPRTAYSAVDWSIVVLLGALIPVAGAMATTGAADLIAALLLDRIAQGHAVAALAVVLIVTMTLSDFMNNAATAAVMCPIALSTATSLDASADPFLMAVAVGASCAFLTPIGHQNNTLILGPGGFRFGDYWRLGLPLEIIVVAVGVPMIMLVWPL